MQYRFTQTILHSRVFGNFIAYVVTVLIKLNTNYAVLTPIVGESDTFVVIPSLMAHTLSLFLCVILVIEFIIAMLYSYFKVSMLGECADVLMVKQRNCMTNRGKNNQLSRRMWS